jgi:hypothetical protein
MMNLTQRSNTMRYQTPLSNDQIEKVAPAVFANEAHEQTSDRYKFIPTIQVVDILRNQGWSPVQAFEARVRNEDRRGFQKHSIRFAKLDNQELIVGDSRPEILLTTAHDGTAKFDFHAALFRLICANGMVVSDTTFQKVGVKHVGFADEDVIDATFRIVNEVPKIAEAVETFRKIELTQEEQVAYAEAALRLRWADTGTEPVEAHKLLGVRRYDDRASDLWRTFNVVQENLIKGGPRGAYRPGQKRQSVRKVTSINEDVRLNKALWTLTEKMVELKG